MLSSTVCKSALAALVLSTLLAGVVMAKVIVFQPMLTTGSHLGNVAVDQCGVGGSPSDPGNINWCMARLSANAYVEVYSVQEVDVIAANLSSLQKVVEVQKGDIKNLAAANDALTRRIDLMEKRLDAAEKLLDAHSKSQPDNAK